MKTPYLDREIELLEGFKDNKQASFYQLQKLVEYREIKQLAIDGVTTRFSPAIAEMKQAIIESLSKLSKGCGKRKWAIEKDTGIPVDILTVLLKQLKIDGKIDLIMIWSESTGRPDGSGYCLTGNLTF